MQISVLPLIPDSFIVFDPFRDRVQSDVRVHYVFHANARARARLGVQRWFGGDTMRTQ